MKINKGSISAIARLVVICAPAMLAPKQGRAIDSETAPANHVRLDLDMRDDNWTTHGGTYLEQRFSKLTQINADNVKKLGLAWFFDLDTNRGQEATPLVVHDVLYTTSSWSKVVALDAISGQLLWKYDPKVPGSTGFKGCCDVVNRGVAYYDNAIFVGTFDGRLIALDAKTGRKLWSVVTVDQSKSYTITGAPRIVKDNVIIGNGGAEYGVRGYVTAYNAKSGKLVWRFYTVPGNPSSAPDSAASDDVMKKARATWFGEYWKSGGGGTVWDAIVYDEELNQVYIGVGNGSPWNRQIRSEGKGDNLFLSSIVALDADTGKYRWHYQETPGESWDFTASQPIILADLKIDGITRKTLMQAPKNGFFYVIDRSTGKLISAKNYVSVNWATGIDMKTGRPLETVNARYTNGPFLASPGGAGAHNWNPMSYSPQTGYVYIPVQELPLLYATDPHFKQRPTQWNTGTDLTIPDIPHDAETRRAIKASLKGWLVAWDPVAQKQIWSVNLGRPLNGGVLSTAGKLVFQGTADGYFKAYNSATGEPLWQMPVQTGVVAGPISYLVDGTQYIAVMAGFGGAAALAMPSFEDPHPLPNGRVLVFSLGGKASLPNLELRLQKPNPPIASSPDSVVNSGKRLYAMNCSFCHGIGTLSAGVLPDLRRSVALSDSAAWQNIVIGGVLETQGMVSFGKIISSDEAEAIRAYVGTEAQFVDKTKSHQN